MQSAVTFVVPSFLEGWMLTEHSNPRTQNIDQLSTLEVVTRMNEEDASVASSVRAALPAIAQAVDAIAERLNQGGRLIYVGAGTSGRLGVLDAAECVPTFSVEPGMVQGIIAGGDKALTTSIEGAEDDPEAGRADLLARGLWEQDAVVGIAASGRTPYVLGAIEAANQIGAVTIGIACNVPSLLLDAAIIPIGIPVGAEVIAGSTRLKAGTAQKMVLNMISTATMIRLGKVYGNLMVDVRVTNTKLADRARRIVAQVAAVTEEEAARLLEASSNEVKTAIVVQRRHVTPEEARRLLNEAGGRLRAIIGEP
jgi:N-acetylmuramic acid 6-phosphate etherase